ncbi:hypothetical protein [Paenibacillus turpanensis]|uniref:hypothetical protein n=1 Tax=Paenibacillus turpanensis TaxID=2689078 RepID=UPI00140A7244|nr:hypothetical protein [Paenibacillus turpanensis]
MNPDKSKKMKYKVCISIPVHEAPDIVVDQINNLRFYYNNECVIVIHISRGFKMPDEIFSDRAYNFIDMEDVIVNPYSYPTQWGDLMYLHNSNFRHACSVVDFDYFVLHASNDLYLRHGSINYIERRQNGVSPHLFEAWHWNPIMEKDNELKKLLQYVGCKKAYLSPVEGTFYKKETFTQMLDLIDNFYCYGESNQPLYPREEVFYPTLMKAMEEDHGTPIAYGPHTIGDKITMDTVFQIRYGVYHNPKTEHLYDFSTLYALKGFPREYNNLYRVIVRRLMEQVI